MLPIFFSGLCIDIEVISIRGDMIRSLESELTFFEIFHVGGTWFSSKRERNRAMEQDR